METIKVIAAAGVKVPMQDKPRVHITDEEAVSVEDSTYYQRRIADGDLVVQDDAPKNRVSRAVADKSTGA